MKLCTVIFSLFIAAVCYTSLRAQPSKAINQKKLDNLTAFYKKKAKQHKIIGSSLALISNDSVIYRHYYGLARVEENEPVDRQTIFHWASITKTFTGIAIMQLRDRGMLKLDDPVTKYIPKLREVHNEHGSMEAITIRQLMSHSSGFRGPTWPFARGGQDETIRWLPHEPQYWSQLVAMFPYTEIKFTPGSQWSYSNLGVIFLGRIIELLTKDDYEYYVEKNILRPLKMYHSYFDKTPYPLVPHLAQSYIMQPDTAARKLGPDYYVKHDGTTYMKARFDLNTGITTSNGGLSASIPDMVKYLNFLLGHADKDAYKYVLSRSSINEMFQPQIQIQSAADTPENVGAQKMGLSFFVGDAYGVHLIGHSGGQNGFISHIYLAPARDIAYVVAYNNWGETRKLDSELMQYIVKHIFAGVEDVR